MELVIRCFEDLMFEPDPNILLSSLALPSPSWKSFLWGFLLSRHLLTYICSGLATLCGLGSVAREGCPPELVSRARSLQLLKCAQGWHFAERAPPMVMITMQGTGVQLLVSRGEIPSVP